MSGKRIVVLGAGVGGLVAASRLRKKLGREHSITLIDKNEWYPFPPSFPWIMVGWREPDRVRTDLRGLRRKGIEFVAGAVEGIDAAAGTVRAGGREVGYDHLVVALGAELHPQGVPGISGEVARQVHSFYDFEGAIRLRDALRSFSGRSVAVVVASLPFKCPAAPCEGPMLIDDMLRRRGQRAGVEISLHTPEPFPMPVAGEKVGSMVRQILEARGIAYHPNRKLSALDAKTGALEFEEGGTVSADLVILIPPHRAPRVVSESALAGEKGWIPVDRNTLRTKFENVFAIGDVTAIQLSNGKPLPKAGVFAHYQAEAVADTIAAEIRGGEKRQFSGKGSCFLEVGGGKAGFAKGDFYAEPNPAVKMRHPSRWQHWNRAWLEKWWLRRWP